MDFFSARFTILFLTILIFISCETPKGEKNQDSFASSPSPQVVICNQKGEKIPLQVEIARTEEQRKRGLMHREALGENQGMLFIMPYSGFHYFWMKNTLFSLDLIFIGEDLKIKGIVKKTLPESRVRVGINQPSKYILEVKAGFADQHQLNPGDRVEFIGIEVMK